MNVLSIDPGGTTGLATKTREGELWVGSTKSKTDLYDLIDCLKKGDVCIVENFLTAGRISTHGLHTVRLVGSVEAICHIKGIHHVKQIPQYRKHMLDIAAKLCPSNLITHERDALAHLLAWEREHVVDSRQSKRDFLKEGRAIRKTVDEFQEHFKRLVDDLTERNNS